MIVAHQVHPNDVTSRSLELVRSPWLDTASGNPRVLLASRDRAAIVLLEAGEPADDVGRHILGARRSVAAASAREVLQRSTAEIGIELRIPSASGIARLRRVLPERALRWAFIVKASGLFTGAEAAALLGIHRASLYRQADRVTSTLRTELA